MSIIFGFSAEGGVGTCTFSDQGTLLMVVAVAWGAIIGIVVDDARFVDES